MKKENLAVLRGYLDTQLEIVQRILEEIARSTSDSKEKISHLGYLLHNLYCALEELFKEVARTFENRLEDPAGYPRELLKRMHSNIPGIRPRLLSYESYVLLDELRAFRHVFRHAYEYELSAARLIELQKKIAANWQIIHSDLDHFTSFIENQIQ